MARPSSSKKVSRAAQTGGGRTGRGGKSFAYWALLALIVVLGVAGVGYSRQERRSELAAGSSTVPPLVNRDHWHTAYGIYICDRFLEPITDQRDPEGIHTHGDGVIHIHPIVRRAAGENARLGRFFDAVRLELSDTEIEVPGGKTYEEGEDDCDGKDAILQIRAQGRKDVVTTDLADFRFDEDRQVITIAFAPKGADIPLPPSAATLDNLSDVPSSGNQGGDTTASTEPPAEGGDAPPGDAPAEDTTTTAAP